MMLLTTILVLGLMALSDARRAQRSHNRQKRAVLPTETLRGESGQFTSPGYPQDYAVDIEKMYMLEFPDPQAYYKVTFTVVDMDIEYQQTCSWDYLLIVADAGGPGRLCGVKTNQVYEIQETQGSVHIKFFSDYIYGKKGFNIEYSLENLSVSSPRPYIVGDILPESQPVGGTARLNCTVLNKLQHTVIWEHIGTGHVISFDETIDDDINNPVVDGEPKFEIETRGVKGRVTYMLIIRGLEP